MVELHLAVDTRPRTRKRRAMERAQASDSEGYRNGVKVLPRQKCRVAGLASGGMQQDAPGLAWKP